MDQSNDHHGRNSLLATYIHYQACVPQESRAYGPILQRPLSIPPQRKHSRSTSQPEVHVNLDTLSTCDIEVSSSILRSPGTGGMERSPSFRADHRLAHHQKKLLHEEIALLWAMASNSARDAVFSNAWYFLQFFFV